MLNHAAGQKEAFPLAGALSFRGSAELRQNSTLGLLIIYVENLRHHKNQ